MSSYNVVVIGDDLAQAYIASHDVDSEDVDGAIDDTWATYTSRISDLYDERLLKDGAENVSERFANVNYTIDQIYLGGARSSTSGAYYADMDVVEVLVFDRTMVCSEIQLIENYFSYKYGITVSVKYPCS